MQKYETKWKSRPITALKSNWNCFMKWCRNTIETGQVWMETENLMPKHIFFSKKPLHKTIFVKKEEESQKLSLFRAKKWKGESKKKKLKKERHKNERKKRERKTSKEKNVFLLSLPFAVLFSASVNSVSLIQKKVKNELVSINKV